MFDRHAGVVFRFLVRRVGRDIADELLGEVFRIAFERRAAFDTDRPSARPWLYGIATNLVAKHWRGEARRLRATGQLAVERGADWSDDVIASASNAHAVARDRGPDRHAPRRRRDALLLYAWEELSYEEIALALDVPVGTVRSRLNRARNRLRELSASGGQQQVAAGGCEHDRIEL